MTIYFTFFRPADLKVFVGPFIIVSRHTSYYAFLVPTTFANQSNQTGVIKRCTLVINHNDTLQKNYHMLWSSFRKLNSEGSKWIQGDTVSSIAVIAKSTENRNIEYTWQIESKPNFNFKEGTYNLQFFFWSNKTKPIAHLKHEIHITNTEADHFNNPNMLGKIIQFPIDNDLNVNEILTSKQVESLLT
jgi:hypothetical protein